MFFFIRGRLHHKNLSIRDAYINDNKAMGELALNGVFTSLTSLRKIQTPNKIAVTQDEALRTVRENLIDAGEEMVPDENYPLMRERVSFNVNGKDYNVVLIFLKAGKKSTLIRWSGQITA